MISEKKKTQKNASVLMCGTLTRASVVQQMRRYLLLPTLLRDAGDVHSAHSLRTPTFDLVQQKKRKRKRKLGQSLYNALTLEWGWKRKTAHMASTPERTWLNKAVMKLQWEAFHIYIHTGAETSQQQLWRRKCQTMARKSNIYIYRVAPPPKKTCINI